MPLPVGSRDYKWPPAAVSEEFRWMRIHSAWYSSDPDRLMDLYGPGDPSPNAKPNGWSWRRFWTRMANHDPVNRPRQALHLPLAADIAATSAALLFSEAPTWRIPEAGLESATATAKSTQERLHNILNEGGVGERILEGAETAAALGGVYLRPVWDQSLAPMPIVSVTQADQAVPEFKWGFLTAVTFFRTIDESDNGSRVVRHLERHEVDPATGKGVVFHGIYTGDRSNLGEQNPDTALQMFPATAGLQPRIDQPFLGLGAHFVPNMRPNRRNRKSYMGQSDYAGAEGMFDALDETYASWMRDVRLAKARVFVPEEYLDADSGFEIDREVFSPLAMDPTAKDRTIHAQQFAIRVAEHMQTCLFHIERAVTVAGYSPQSFGLHIEGRAEAGIALKIRENKTFMTQQRKAAWWRSTLALLSWQLLQIDREIFKTPGVDADLRPEVDISDSVAENPLETAQIVTALFNAQAASAEARVRLVHPDFDDDEVKAEVARILEQFGAAVPNPDVINPAGAPVPPPPPGDEEEAEEAEDAVTA